MWAPRSAVPEVATARSRPVTIGEHPAAVERVGDADAPRLAGRGLAGQLHVAAAVDRVVRRCRRARSSWLACSIAQPLTRPVGSMPSRQRAVK